MDESLALLCSQPIVFFQWCHVDDLKCTPPETLPLNSTNVFWHCRLSRSKSILQPRFPCFTVDANTFTASDESPPNVVIFVERFCFLPYFFTNFVKNAMASKCQAPPPGWFG